MKRLALLALAVVLPLSASADVVGTYLISNGKEHRQTMTIQYKDDQHIRMETGQGTYLLITGTKAYAVTVSKGKTTAIDLDTLPQINVPANTKPATESKTKITKTGRTETIAGIKGDVYEITGEGQKHEVVLSTDKRAGMLNRSFMGLAKRMAKMANRQGGDASAQIDASMREAEKYGYGALLRSDQNFVLQSLSDASLPASNYQLPPGVTPTAIPAMPAGFGAPGQPGQMPQMDPATMKKMQEQMQKMMQQQGR